jgi:hypothetical protein
MSKDQGSERHTWVVVTNDRRVRLGRLLASSSSTGTAATAISPTFSKAISIALSFALCPERLDERNTAPPALVAEVPAVVRFAIVAHVVTRGLANLDLR